MKYLVGLLALAAVGFGTRDSYAWFKVCNQTSENTWVAFSHFVSKEQKVNFTCATETAVSPCYYSAWKTDGWWRINKNTCVTVSSSNVTSHLYIRADYDDGSFTGSSSFPIRVQDPEFHWDHGDVLHGSSCVVGSGVFDPCNNQSYTSGFLEINTYDSAHKKYFSNFTMTLTD